MRWAVLVTLLSCLPVHRVVATPLDRGLKIKVGRKDTVERLAVRYYGAKWTTRAVLLANGKNGLARRLPRVRAGSTLRLPTSWSYRIRQGDTWEALGRDYLGDPRRGLFLARINSKRVGKVAPTGHVILVPALVPVRLPRRPSLAKIAAQLLDLPERDGRVSSLVGWIRDLNRIKGRARGGARILVPLATLRLLGWYLPTALPARDPGAIRRAREILGRAQVALRRGLFLSAASSVGPLLGRPGLPRELRVEAHRIQCTAWVALGRTKLALRAARAALRLQPGLVLDPVQVSPKVRKVFERARRRN